MFVSQKKYNELKKENQLLGVKLLLEKLKVRFLEQIVEEFEELKKELEKHEAHMQGLSKEGGSKKPKSETVQDMSKGEKEVG